MSSVVMPSMSDENVGGHLKDPPSGPGASTRKRPQHGHNRSKDYNDHLKSKRIRDKEAGYVQQPDPWTAKMKGEYSKYCDLQKEALGELEMPYPEMKISADGHAALVQPATNSMIDGRIHGKSRHDFCDKHPYAYPSHEDTTNHRNMANNAMRDSDEAEKNLYIHKQHRSRKFVANDYPPLE
ncbi:hypothetical protein EYC84_001003 [Monilinia fructicola]|uniref:Uncharacterized protein n=1 Tax=Monilinia fructicola TaxID=38448 RepID=A0A5M9JLU5_MONFR|nr:hypothetical protein EYC84_001003 [Monilinia fructicola]